MLFIVYFISCDLICFLFLVLASPCPLLEINDKFRKSHLKVKSGRKLKKQDTAQQDQLYHGGVGQVAAEERT